MSDFKDRCGGCEHTTGFELPFRGASTITQCALGYKVPISEGCSEFTPDITANCKRCYFYTTQKTEEGYKPHCPIYNITSIMPDNFPGGNGFCEAFYYKNNYDEETKEVKSGCFIATAVYDSPNAPKVIILKNFRDNFLLKCYLGKVFVNYYYKYSPSIAKYLLKHTFFKKTTKYVFIEPIVLIVKFFIK